MAKVNKSGAAPTEGNKSAKGKKPRVKREPTAMVARQISHLRHHLRQISKKIRRLIAKYGSDRLGWPKAHQKLDLPAHNAWLKLMGKPFNDLWPSAPVK